MSYFKHDDKPPKVQAPVGGMVPQKPKPPIESQADTRGKRDKGSFVHGKPTHPTGGGGSASNKKPTP